MNEDRQWLDMISRLEPQLHLSYSVIHSSSNNDKKIARIYNYFKRLDGIHNRVRCSNNNSAEKLLKEYYYRKYVITPKNIPESYFENQKRIARERGYGDILIDENLRSQMINQIIDDQKKSLDVWIDYFLYDEDGSKFSIYEKYWIFQGLQTLGKFDKVTGKFSKRDMTTIYPFPILEKDAVMDAIRLMNAYLNDKNCPDEIKNTINNGNFKKIYEYSIKTKLINNKNLTSTDGKWIKYNQGDDYSTLKNSLQGYYTGWCTAVGDNFAKVQLANGDFYVYYSLDKDGEAKVPRIAIRMHGNSEIAEIRGIASDQNVEAEMLPILEEKLKEFLDKDKYLKKEHDMKMLTEIDNKCSINQQLTRNEIIFLYELKDKITGFGFKSDPRIIDIKSGLNEEKCLNNCFAATDEWSGRLILNSLVDLNKIKLPKTIRGNLYLNEFNSIVDFKFPEIVYGILDLSNIMFMENVEFPKFVYGNVYIGNVLRTKNVKFPEMIFGSFDICKLEETKRDTFPKFISGNVYSNNSLNFKNKVPDEYIGKCKKLIIK